MKFYKVTMSILTFIMFCLPLSTFADNNTFPLVGEVGIGTVTPKRNLDIQGEHSAEIILGAKQGATNFRKWNMIVTDGGSTGAKTSFGIRQINDATNDADFRILINADGNVGIGTTNPQSKLVVNGTITAQEINVSSSGWSDFVFNDNYKLLPIDQLKEYIASNKRLPDMPSAKELAENNIVISEMLAKQMQKIEELTLYVIDLKNENDKLKKELKKHFNEQD